MRRYEKIKHKNRDEWLKTRQNCITATDCARILGKSRFGDGLKVYNSKINPEFFEDKEINAMYFGRKLEPIGIDAFEDHTGLKAKQNGLTIYRLKSKPFFACTPDAIISDNRKPIGLEVKTSRVMGGWPTVPKGQTLDCGDCSEIDLPIDVECQVQWSLGITGFSHWYVVALLQGSDFRVYKVRPNQKSIELLQEVAEKFWVDHILKQNPPEPTFNSDRKDLDKLYPKAAGEVLVLNGESSEAAHYLKTYQDAVEAAKLATATKEFAALKLKAIIKDAPAVEIEKDDQTWIAQWANKKGSLRFDVEALKKEHPELYENYLTRGKSSRAFSLKQKRK